MFTGIIIERGRLLADPQTSGGGLRIEIGLSPELAVRLGIGDSLAVSGVCLTVVGKDVDRVAVELSPETLARTNLGELRGGDAVNLEPALRMGDPLGGHWVQGHVDAAARVLAFSIPPDLAPFLVEKGSVTVDGVSLTVSALLPDRFEVALIPHTLEVTTLSRRSPGDRVNLEVDVLGKYVHRILAARGLVAPLPEAGGGWP
jgi:riboflavin synthase